MRVLAHNALGSGHLSEHLKVSLRERSRPYFTCAYYAYLHFSNTVLCFLHQIRTLPEYRIRGGKTVDFFCMHAYTLTDGRLGGGWVDGWMVRLIDR